MPPDAVLVVAAGFGGAALLTAGVTRFVARGARNVTARRHVVPADKGRGRGPVYGERVRPLPRTHQGKRMAATLPDATAQWGVGGRMIHAPVWDTLGCSRATPGGPAFRCVVIHDPRSQEPLVVATTLPVSACALWRLSRARWPIAQVPRAATQRLGTHRAFVCGSASRERLPEVARLAGNVVAYVAAPVAAGATGLWARHCRPTCGRVRRVLLRVAFCELPVPEGT